jgi:hypothetical protein
MSAIDDFLSYDEERGIQKEAAFGMKNLLPLIGLGARKAAPEAAEAGGKGFAEAVGSAMGEVGEAAAADAGKSWLRRAGESLLGFGGRTAKTVAPVLALGGTLAGTEAAFNAASNAISRSRGFKGMMESNPDLAKMDQKRVNAAFKTLHRFNPEMASDPYVAGGWVKRVTDYDYVDPKTIGDLVAARSRASKPGVVERGLPLAALGAQMAETENRQAFDVQKLMIADTLQRRRDQEARDAAQDVAIAQAKGKALGTASGQIQTIGDLSRIEHRKAQAKALGTARAITQQPETFTEAAIPGEKGKLFAQQQVSRELGLPSPGDLEYQKEVGKLRAREDYGVYQEKDPFQ